MGEELEDLTLQRLIGGEETLGVEYLPDRELLMLSCRNCGRDKLRTLLFRHTSEDAFTAFEDEVLSCMVLSK